MEIKIEEWHGEPIGDMSEEKIREHFNLTPEDKAYLVHIDGKLVFFQYIVPFVAGRNKLNASNITEAMEEHRRRLEANLEQ